MDHQYPIEIPFIYGNMQHTAILIHNTQEPLDNSNNNSDFSECFICEQPAMSKPFYISDITGFMVHASCAFGSARIIAGEHNRSILPPHLPHLPHPPLHLHQQPPQHMNHYPSVLPPPPNYNYVNGSFNAPYPPPYFNLHQQQPPFMNYSYSNLPPPPNYFVNGYNYYAPYPTPYPYNYYAPYYAPPLPPPHVPQNIQNNHHNGYGGILGMLGTSVVGAFIQTIVGNLLSGD